MRNQRINHIISLALSTIVIMLSFIGCKSDNSEIAEKIVEGPHLSDLVETDTLVIYIQPNSEALERRRIDMFQKSSGVKVEVVRVDADSKTFAERVLNDVAGGGGPDIIFTDQMIALDLWKTAVNHGFLDLTEILAEDPDFHEEDYLDGVFETGRYNGRQYTIPLSYQLRFAVSPAEMLKKLGFDWEKIDTMEDFLNEIVRLTPKAKDSYPSFKKMMAVHNYLFNLLWSSGVPLIDYESGKVLPDEKAFRELLEAYKAYYTWDYDESTYGKGVWHPNEKVVLSGGQYTFWLPGNIENLASGLCIAREKDCEICYQVIPDMTGNTTACVDTQIAIRANAVNTLNAWKFVKYMLSDDAQEDQWASLYYSLPIRKSAVMNRLRNQPAVTAAGTYDYANYAISEEEAEDIYNMLTDIDRFVPRLPQAPWEFVEETMLPFLQDEKSYNDCLKELKSKLTFYLSE